MFRIRRARVYILIVAATVLYPAFLFFSRLHARGKPDAPRVLVVPQFNRLGDLICLTPMFRAFKERYPSGFLSVVVGAYGRSGEIIKHNPFVDDIIVFEHKEYTDALGLFRFFQKVRKRRFDWSINCAASPLGTLLSVFGFIPNRSKVIREDFARSLPERLSDWMNTHPFHYRRDVQTYLVAFFLEMLAPFDVPMPLRIKKEVFPTREGDAKAQRFLAAQGFKDGDCVVGVSVTAGSPTKEWGIEKFGALLRALVSKYHAKVVFIGSPKDRAKIEEVNQYIGNSGAVAADIFTIEELPSLVKRLSFFIAADTGPIHIAEALGVPLIDIVGPVDPDALTPRGEKSIVVRPQGVEPTVFALRPPGDPTETKRALQVTTVLQVLEAFEALMQKT